MPNPDVPSRSLGRQTERPKGGPRWPLSRRIRLRRTVAGALGLAVLVAVALMVARPFDTGPFDTGPFDAGPLAAARTGGPAASSATTTAGAGRSSSASGTSTEPAGAATTPSPSVRAGTTHEQDADGSGEPEPAARPATVVQRGSGAIRVVPVDGPQSTATGRVVRYTVEIEDGLGVDQRAVASTIRTVLLDPRGWQAKDRVRFVNVGPAEAARGAHVDIRITLASPATTDRLCAPLRTLSQVSCWSAGRGRSVLNLRRWLLGDDSYGTDVARYRTYQVNHEVGHGLGHGHHTCPGRGARAPVMLQQTFSLGGCKAWPFPTGA